MKNIKKILLFLLTLTLALGVFAGCESLDVESAATVTVTVTSPAPDVTLKSSRGKVTKSGKTFTIALDNRATFNYSVSASGYETYYSEINALDLKDKKNLEINVSLATDVNAVVTLIVSNKDKVEITSSNDKAKITTKGKTHTIILPSRGKSGETTLSVSGENLETRKINISSEQIKSGYYFTSTSLTKENTVQVELKNFNVQSITSLNYNVYENEEVGQVNYFSIPRGEEFLVNGVYFKVSESAKAYDDFIFDLGNDKRDILKRKIYVSKESDYAYDQLYVENQNSFERTYIERESNGNSDNLFVRVAQPGRLVLISYMDGKRCKHEISFTEDDLNSKVVLKITEFGKPSIPGVEVVELEKRLNEETGEEILDTENIYEKYTGVNEEMLFDGNNLVRTYYYKPLIEIQIPFETDGLIYDRIETKVYFGNKSSVYSSAEYVDGRIIIGRGIISYKELLTIEVSFQKIIQIDEYNYKVEEVAKERIVQHVNKNSFVGGKYISNVKETFSKYKIINKYNFLAVPNEVRDYGVKNGYIYEWIQNFEAISGELLQFEDWLTSNSCYRLTNETVFKIVYNPAYQFVEVTLRTIDEFTLKTLPKDFENLRVEILVPFDPNI